MRIGQIQEDERNCAPKIRPDKNDAEPTHRLTAEPKCRGEEKDWRVNTPSLDSTSLRHYSGETGAGLSRRHLSININTMHIRLIS